MQSGFLTPPSAMHQLGEEPAFRLALKLIAIIYEMSVSTDLDLPALGSDLNNGILRDMLNSLATDACTWVCRSS